MKKQVNWQQTYRVLAKRGPESQLVKSQALSTSLLNPSPGGFSEPQSGHFQSRDFINSNVVCHSPDDHSDLTILPVHVPNQSGKGERGLVHLAHEQPLQNHRTELTPSPPYKKPIQLKPRSKNKSIPKKASQNKEKIDIQIFRFKGRTFTRSLR